jgi:prolyl 4-hydroxylase
MVYPYLNVLSPLECLEIIKNTEEYLQPLKVYSKEGGDIISPDRVAEGTFIQDNPPLIRKIKKIISEVTSLPISHQEVPNVVRYRVGGKYEPHHDYIDLNSHSHSEYAESGNRKYTCLFYLNNNFEGGETYFPNYNLKIGPTIGSLVRWENLHPNGNPNPNSLHAGLPIIKGEKWILVVWVKEKSINPNNI